MLLPMRQGSGHHLLKINEQHLEVPFYCFVLSHYFSYGAGILSIPKQNLNILLLRKIFYIALYSVFI